MKRFNPNTKGHQVERLLASKFNEYEIIEIKIKGTEYYLVNLGPRLMFNAIRLMEDYGYKL